MDGYHFETTFVTPGPTHSPAVLAGGMRAQLSGRSSDLLHVQGEVAAALCLPSLALRPSVLTINGLHLVRRLEGWRRRLAVANLRLIVRAASRTICVGDAEFDEVESLVDSARLVLVRNGVDPVPRPTIEERAAARTALGIPAERRVGLYLAALDPHKEPITVARAALDAVRKGAPLVLLFAGDGPLRKELEALAGDDAVLRLVGFQSDVRHVLAASDFFVLPSRREGLSFALLEAMAAALPPVVSDAPGNPDAVGDAGIVVRQGDIEGFRAAFERLTLDETERERLGERARQRVAERFDTHQMLEGTRAVYEDVLEVAR
jgi:glycosyltransferase involved in cell wall biosynthesis